MMPPKALLIGGLMNPGVYNPALGAQVEAFAAELAPDQVAQFLQLVSAVEEAGAHSSRDESEREWRLIVAHLPGIAPALAVLRAHVQGCELLCCRDAGTPQARYIGLEAPREP